MMDAAELVAALGEITVDLDGYLERRAAELAQPMIDMAKDEAAKRIREADAETTRQTDLVKELRRQLAPAVRYADSCKERVERAERERDRLKGIIRNRDHEITELRALLPRDPDDDGYQAPGEGATP